MNLTHLICLRWVIFFSQLAATQSNCIIEIGFAENPTI
jgi:hypothetical protein